MATKKTYLPLVELLIDTDMSDDSGVTRISIVDDPAIEVKGVAFANSKKMEMTADVDRQILAGPIMIPNFEIYRAPCPGYPNGYYAIYSQATVRKIMEKFAKMSNSFSINFMHTDEMVDAYVLEMWEIEDPKMDKAVMRGYEDATPGTWFGYIKVEDKKFFETQVKNGKYQGFSIEGIMIHQEVDREEYGQENMMKAIDALSKEDLIAIFSDLIAQK